MFCKHALATLAFAFALVPATLAVPQYGPAPSDSSPSLESNTTSGMNATMALPNGATLHMIAVGGPSGQLTFAPSNITAAPGDVLQFMFMQKNHTATQSAFAAPCAPLPANGTAPAGFDSGFMPVPAGVTSGFPTFNVTVNDTKPIWVYCRQTNHCGQGMVFAANANASAPNNYGAFRANAMASANGSAAAGGNATTGSTGRSGALGRAQAGGYAAAAAVGFGVLLGL